MDDLLADFVAETEPQLDQIDADYARLCETATDRAALDRAFRGLHTIKGACGFLHLARIEALMHASETALERVRDGRAGPDMLTLLRHASRVVRQILSSLVADAREPAGNDHELIEALTAAPHALDWAVELAHARDKLLSLASEKLAAPFQRLAHVAADFSAPAQYAPIETAWRTLPLIVQDLSATLAKPISLELAGIDTEVSRTAIAPLKDALGHLIRNCADHGLEPPEERRALGKDKTGLIRVSAAREGETIIVRLEDDGRGLDTARIRARAIARGLVFASDAARMSADQIHRFIFAPGFSTTEKTTRHSGRGIGLDAVRAAIEALGGTVAIESERGEGAAFILMFPAEIRAAAPVEEALPALPIDDARVA